MKYKTKNSMAALVAGAVVLLAGSPCSYGVVIHSEDFEGYASGTQSTSNTGSDTLGDGWYTSNESATITDPAVGTLAYATNAIGDGYLSMGPANTIYCLKPLDAAITSTVTKVVMTGKYINSSSDIYVGLHTSTPVPPPGNGTFTFNNKTDAGSNYIKIGTHVSNQQLKKVQNQVVDFVFTLEQSGGPGTDVIATLSYQTNATGFIDVTFGSGAAETNAHNFGPGNALSSIVALYIRAAYNGGMADAKIDAFSGEVVEPPVPSTFIYDDFANNDLATGGVGTTNAGFVLKNRVAEVQGTAIETNDLAVVSISTNSALGPAGIVSIKSFNTTQVETNGFKATWVVDSLATNVFNKLFFGIQKNTGLFNGSANSGLSFAIDDGLDGIKVNGLTNGTSTTLASGTIAVAPGSGSFTFVATASSNGWSYSCAELGMTGSGPWAPGFDYSTLFDATTFVSAWIQQVGANSAGMSIDSITVSPISGEAPPEDPVAGSFASIGPVAGNLIRLVISGSTLTDIYPYTKSDLVYGSWASVPHSDNGINPFVVTNLGYSSVSGSNAVIYVQGTNAAGFFGLGL